MSIADKIRAIQPGKDDNISRSAFYGFNEARDEAARIAEAEEARLREAMKGYPDSDLVSLATTLRARAELCDAKDEELEAWREWASTLTGTARATSAQADKQNRDAINRYEENLLATTLKLSSTLARAQVHIEALAAIMKEAP